MLLLTWFLETCIWQRYFTRVFNGLGLFWDHLWHKGQVGSGEKHPGSCDLLNTPPPPHLCYRQNMKMPISVFLEGNRSHPNGICRRWGVCLGQEGVAPLQTFWRDLSKCLPVSFGYFVTSVSRAHSPILPSPTLHLNTHLCPADCLLDICPCKKETPFRA